MIIDGKEYKMFYMNSKRKMDIYAYCSVIAKHLVKKTT